MGLTVHIQHSAEISELVSQYSCFSYLINSTIPQIETNLWYMNNNFFDYSEQRIYQLQAIFIGKTGYGKSTTLNNIVGKNVFKTSDVSVCTKDLYEVTYRVDKGQKTFLSLCDLPGVGESNYADSHYYEWYRDMLAKSHCVVYILRADQRDFAVDEILLRELFPSKESKEKLIIAINFADKIEPINRHGGLTQEQRDNLDKRISQVSQVFKLPHSSIIYYSAEDRINLDILVSLVAQKLQKHVR